MGELKAWIAWKGLESLKALDPSFQMSVRMIELDSSYDDVELVELDSSVELVSVSGGESEGQVSPPRARVPPRAQSPAAPQLRSQAGDQVIVRQMANGKWPW